MAVEAISQLLLHRPFLLCRINCESRAVTDPPVRAHQPSSFLLTDWTTTTTLRFHSLIESVASRAVVGSPLLSTRRRSIEEIETNKNKKIKKSARPIPGRAAKWPLVTGVGGANGSLSCPFSWPSSSNAKASNSNSSSSSKFGDGTEAAARDATATTRPD